MTIFFMACATIKPLMAYGTLNNKGYLTYQQHNYNMFTHMRSKDQQWIPYIYSKFPLKSGHWNCYSI